MIHLPSFPFLVLLPTTPGTMKVDPPRKTRRPIDHRSSVTRHYRAQYHPPRPKPSFFFFFLLLLSSSSPLRHVTTTLRQVPGGAVAEEGLFFFRNAGNGGGAPNFISQTTTRPSHPAVANTEGEKREKSTPTTNSE